MSKQSDWVVANDRWPFWSTSEVQALGLCECGHRFATHIDGGRCGSKQTSSCACLVWNYDDERSDPEFFVESGVDPAKWPDYVWAYHGRMPPAKYRQ